jgi:hypothetical protein
MLSQRAYEVALQQVDKKTRPQGATGAFANEPAFDQ